MVFSFIGRLGTGGVFGFGALLVRMEDVGFSLIDAANEKNTLLKKVGETLVVALPKVIKVLTVVGTLAMLLVAGGIYVHNVHQLHDALHFMPSLLAELLVGLVIGLIVLVVEKLFMKTKSAFVTK